MDAAHAVARVLREGAWLDTDGLVGLRLAGLAPAHDPLDRTSCELRFDTDGSPVGAVPLPGVPPRRRTPVTVVLAPGSSTAAVRAALDRLFVPVAGYRLVAVDGRGVDLRELAAALAPSLDACARAPAHASLESTLVVHDACAWVTNPDGLGLEYVHVRQDASRDEDVYPVWSMRNLCVHEVACEASALVAGDCRRRRRALPAGVARRVPEFGRIPCLRLTVCDEAALAALARGFDWESAALAAAYDHVQVVLRTPESWRARLEIVANPRPAADGGSRPAKRARARTGAWPSASARAWPDKSCPDRAFPEGTGPFSYACGGGRSLVLSIEPRVGGP